MVTYGVEHESWDWELVDEVASLTGWSVHEDHSGPEELETPPFPVYSPYPAILVSFLYPRWDADLIYNEDGNETAGQHVHVSGVSLRRAYRVSRRLLPLLQYLFAAEYYIESGYVEVVFTSRRRYWARPPPPEMPNERMYYAVTFNPAEESKPDTLEYRICETMPLKCIAAVQVIVASLRDQALRETLETLADGLELYEDTRIPLERLERMARLVEASVSPRWVGRLVRLSVKKQLLEPRLLYQHGIVTLEDLKRTSVECARRTETVGSFNGFRVVRVSSDAEAASRLLEIMRSVL